MAGAVRGVAIPVALRCVRPDFAAAWVAFAVVSFTMASLGPVLDSVRAEFGASYAGAGLVVAVQGIGRGGFMLLVGPLADRYAPRGMLVGGLVLVAAGAGTMALAPTFGIVMLGTVIAGAGTALIQTSGQAHIMRTARPERRRHDVGRLVAGIMVGGLIAPLPAGALASAFGWRAAFLPAGALALGSAALVWSTPKLTAPPDTPGRPRIRGLRVSDLGIDRTVAPIAALAVLAWGWANAMRGIVLPLYGSVALRLEPALVGLVLSLTFAGRAVQTFFSGSSVARLGWRGALLAGTVTGAAGVLVMAGPAHPGVYAAMAVAFAFGGLVSPLVHMLIADRVPSNRVGRAIGVTQFSVDLVGLGIPPLLGALLDSQGFASVGILLAGVYLSTAVVGLVVATRTRAPATVPD